MVTKPQLLEQTSKLAAVWPRDRWTSERLDAWWDVLRHQHPQDLAWAIAEVLRTHKGSSAPPPAAVLDLCRTAARKREQDAKERLLLEPGGPYVPNEWVVNLIRKLREGMEGS